MKISSKSESDHRDTYFGCLFFQRQLINEYVTKNQSSWYTLLYFAQLNISKRAVGVLESVHGTQYHIGSVSQLVGKLLSNMMFIIVEDPAIESVTILSQGFSCYFEFREIQKHLAEVHFERASRRGARRNR